MRVVVCVCILVFGVLGLHGAPAVSAKEYRKCQVQYLVSASAFRQFVLPNVRFTAWGRLHLASRAWWATNLAARSCARALVWGSGRALPRQCAANQHCLRQSDCAGAGVSGIMTLEVRNRIKRAICAIRWTPPSRTGRNPADRRVLDAFQVHVGPVGPSRACLTQVIVPPQRLVLYCNRAGQDTRSVWFITRR